MFQETPMPRGNVPEALLQFAQPRFNRFGDVHLSPALNSAITGRCEANEHKKNRKQKAGSVVQIDFKVGLAVEIDFIVLPDIVLSKTTSVLFPHRYCSFWSTS